MIKYLSLIFVFTASCTAPATEEQSNADKYRNASNPNQGNAYPGQNNQSTPLPDNGNTTPSSPSQTPGSANTSPATTSSICQKLNSLEGQLMCRITSASECTSYGNQNCLNEISSVLDCFAQNIRGCMCESSGSLNCEGTYKANEVPEIGAPCADATRRYAQCEERFSPAGSEAGSEAGSDAGYDAGSSD